MTSDHWIPPSSKTWKERLLEQDDVEVNKNILAEMLEIIKRNKIDMKQVFKVMCGETGKINTLYFSGPANCGKTMLIRLLASVWGRDERGIITPSGGEPSFTFQDCIRKEVYIGDECMMHPKNVEQYKMLMEGSDMLKVDVKNKPKQWLPKKPVILANNVSIWSQVQNHYTALISRCLLIKMKPGDTLCKTMGTREEYMAVLHLIYMLNQTE